MVGPKWTGAACCRLIYAPCEARSRLPLVWIPSPNAVAEISLAQEHRGLCLRRWMLLERDWTKEAKGGSMAPVWTAYRPALGM